MKKPQLSDYGLTELMLKTNKEQLSLYRKKLEEHLEKNKKISKWLFLSSCILTVIAFIISAATGFDKNVSGYTLGISTFLLSIFGIYWFQTKDESVWSISFDKINQIEKQVVDMELNKAISDYKKALSKYEEAQSSINEYSIVKAELLIPSFINRGDYTSLGARLIVFSNTHLLNPQSFPELESNIYSGNFFEEKYCKLIEKQKKITPKPKNYIQIQAGEKIEFYYTYSNMFIAMNGKKEGDIVNVSALVPYRILKVINI